MSANASVVPVHTDLLLKLEALQIPTQFFVFSKCTLESDRYQFASKRTDSQAILLVELYLENLKLQ